MTTKDRIRGALYGVAYGDAMGMPAEFFTREQIREKLGWIDGLRPGHPDNPISAHFGAGEVTDDTLMSCIIARQLADTGELDSLLMVNRIRDWAEQNGKSKNVIGPSTKAALERIAQGMPLAEAGKAGVTNGAAMKIVPVGLATPIEHMELLLRRVHAACLPTHNTHVAIGGAAAVAAAVSCAVSGVEDMDALMDCAIQAARMGEEMGHKVISPLVSERLQLVRQMPMTVSDEVFLARVSAWIGTGLPIADSVPAAFAVLLFSRGEPARCALLCANLGGDTDTIGAIATAMAGALRGPDAFPAPDMRRIVEVNQLELDDLAERLSGLRLHT